MITIQSKYPGDMKNVRKSTRRQPKTGTGGFDKLQLLSAVLIFQELRRLERTQGGTPLGIRHHVD